MKEAQDTRKKSILSKIIDALKNSILSDILFSEEAGQAVSKIPTPKKESPNPFKVDESELSQETSSLVQNTSERTRDSGGKSLDD